MYIEQGRKREHEDQETRRARVSNPGQINEDILMEIRDTLRTLGTEIATAKKELAGRITIVETELAIVKATMAKETDLKEMGEILEG